MPAGRSRGLANVWRTLWFAQGCDGVGLLLGYASTEAATVNVDVLNADLLLVAIGASWCNQEAVKSLAQNDSPVLIQL